MKNKKILDSIYKDLCFVAKKYKKFKCEVHLIDNNFKIIFDNYTFFIKTKISKRKCLLILKYNNKAIYEHEINQHIFFYNLLFKAIKYNIRQFKRENIKEEK